MNIRRFGLAIVATLAAVSSEGGAAPERAKRPAVATMVRIRAGQHRSMYGARRVAVAGFRIDRDVVTRRDFGAWRGQSIRGDDARRPMTNVSWRDASAYCAARGARLPTVVEWEYVAAASVTARDGRKDPGFTQQLIDWYSTRSSHPQAIDAAASNAYGVRGLHDLVWEWVADPNDHLAAAHHRMQQGQSNAREMNCAGAALGAADPGDYPAFLRAAIRSGLDEDTRMQSLGFRCAL